MASLADLLLKFKELDAQKDVVNANWYIVAAAALASAGAGPDLVDLYRFATLNVPLDVELVVQRRIKEAVLKTSCLYGVPKSLQALLPLFASLPDDHIDHAGPRYSASSSERSVKAREIKGKAYFDTLWGEEAAQLHRDRNFKYQPDLYLLNLKHIYEWHFSEDSILGAVETQSCNVAALICANCPVQAMWHARGLLRHGGALAQAKLAQAIGLEIAALYECKTGEIVPVEDIDITTKSHE
ncbi:hypothetical protein E8E14_011646 [Neopestalotiopsis sp. 37M]|nr:hypothetical protein E8E14_011646 [Neopestalotiopsis sp. 37M]